MLTEKEWRNFAKKSLKKEIRASLISMNDLAEILGIKANSLRSKILHGNFSAGFFLQVMDILSVENIKLEDLKKNPPSLEKFRKS